MAGKSQTAMAHHTARPGPPTATCMKTSARTKTLHHNEARKLVGLYNAAETICSDVIYAPASHTDHTDLNIPKHRYRGLIENRRGRRQKIGKGGGGCSANARDNDDSQVQYHCNHRRCPSRSPPARRGPGRDPASSVHQTSRRHQIKRLNLRSTQHATRQPTPDFVEHTRLRSCLQRSFVFSPTARSRSGIRQHSMPRGRNNSAAPHQSALLLPLLQAEQHDNAR